MTHVLLGRILYTDSVVSSCTPAGPLLHNRYKIIPPIFLQGWPGVGKMPPAIAEWPVKNFAALYLALYKESTNTKLTAANSRAIDNNLPIYIESYFPDTYGDTGTLQGRADLEFAGNDGAHWLRKVRLRLRERLPRNLRNRLHWFPRLLTHIAGLMQPTNLC